jgi:hypothetical protein
VLANAKQVKNVPGRKTYVSTPTFGAPPYCLGEDTIARSFGFTRSLHRTAMQDLPFTCRPVHVTMTAWELGTRTCSALSCARKWK